MLQEILLGIILVAAVFYMGRFIYRQSKAGSGDAHCDKCLPKESLKEKG